MRVLTSIVLGLSWQPAGVQAVALTWPRQGPPLVAWRGQWGVGAGDVEEFSSADWAACGDWLKAELRQHRLRPRALAVAVDDARTVACQVDLPPGLSKRDVCFQQQAVVCEAFPHVGERPLIDARAAPWLQALPRSDGLALQRLAQGLRCRLACVSHVSGVRAAVPEAKDDVAWGVALAMGQPIGQPVAHALAPNFLCDAELDAAVRQRQWAQRCAVSGVLGAASALLGLQALTAVAAWQNATLSLPSLEALEAQHAVISQATQVHEQQLQAWTQQQQRGAAWAQRRQWHEQWWQVLAQAPNIGLSEVRQQGLSWQAKGEALSAEDARRLQRALAGLPLWQQAPTFTQQSLGPGRAQVGPVWHFQLEATLRP